MPVLDWSLEEIYGPANEPVSLVEAKAQLEIPSATTDHDRKVRALIKAARLKVETDSRRKLVCQTWDQRQDAWPGDDKLQLRISPLLSLTSLKYVDTDGNTQTWGSSNYEVDTRRRRPCIWQAYGVDWPSNSTRSVQNAVIARAVVGYGDEFTAATNDVITPSRRQYTDGDIVQLSNYGGALPAGLSANTAYYVRDATATTLKLETSVGGGAVDITDTGTGTHLIDDPPPAARHAVLMLVAHWFESREAVVVGIIATELALAYQALINTFSLGNYP